MFAYGFLSVVLVLYLAELGFSAKRIGLLLTLTLVGDTAISLWITTHADTLYLQRGNPNSLGDVMAEMARRLQAGTPALPKALTASVRPARPPARPASAGACR